MNRLPNDSSTWLIEPQDVLVLYVLADSPNRSFYFGFFAASAPVNGGRLESGPERRIRMLGDIHPLLGLPDRGLCHYGASRRFERLIYCASTRVEGRPP